MFRCTEYGGLTHLRMAGEKPSTAAMFSELYDGRDTTNPIEWDQNK
ncbi:MAG: hypothetical protein Q4C54_05760 [Clostridia bacterium]|nr:hypothetical protein [Clostridia bacterium]